MDDIDAKMILSALPPEDWKRPSSYHMIQDCKERPEIPQPDTDQGTWCGSERLTLEAAGNVQRYVL